jgi:hypothetical protein
VYDDKQRSQNTDRQKRATKTEQPKQRATKQRTFRLLVSLFWLGI